MEFKIPMKVIYQGDVWRVIEQNHTHYEIRRGNAVIVVPIMFTTVCH